MKYAWIDEYLKGKPGVTKDLQKDSRIELHENTDIRTFNITEEIDTVTIDVSFTSNDGL